MRPDWARRVSEDLIALLVGYLVSVLFAVVWIREIRIGLAVYAGLVGFVFVWIGLVVYGELWPVFIRPRGKRTRSLVTTLLTCGLVFAVGLLRKWVWRKAA